VALAFLPAKEFSSPSEKKHAAKPSKRLERLIFSGLAN
jgi:hypothetical protein